MNMIKRVLSLALVCAMMLTLLCACGGDSEVLAKKQEELCSGKWLTHESDSEEQALILLENIDLYEEEIAVADLGSLKYSVIIEYSMDGTYRQYISVPHTKEHVRTFYQETFEALFENRTLLSELYETDLGVLSEEEFLLFYASLYGFEDFNDLLNEFVENAYDYQWEDLESGTYRVSTPNKLAIERVSTDPAAEPSGSITFKLSGDTLSLDYSDGTVVYTNIG